VINYAFTVYSRVARARFNRTPAIVIVRGARINSIASVTAQRKLVIIEYQTAGCFGSPARSLARFLCIGDLVNRASRKLDARPSRRLSRSAESLGSAGATNSTGLSRNRTRARARADLRRWRAGTPRKKSKITAEALSFPSKRACRVSAPPRRFVDG